MSKKTGYLLGMLLTIIICSILAWIFCCGNYIDSSTSVKEQDTAPNNQNTVVYPDKTTAMGFTLRGPDGNFAFKSNDNFNFEISDFNILSPISVEVNEGIDELQAYFNNETNSDKRIDITGFYDNNEQNTSAFENLGLARANAIKNYFVKRGISSARINTYGKLQDNLIPDNSIYKGPVAYRIFAQAQTDRAATQAEMAKVAKALNEEPLILYFDYAESSVTLTQEQRYKIGDIARYLDKIADATITVEGHTDNEGTNTTNDRLGLERAEFAKAYLANNGIPGGKIKTVSKGKRNPLVSNSTEEGRARNRRAVILLN